ncbi:unnamed protein product [Zymoseptoria tritici ST99CH_3D1]|nr:unnamed protein product [Zymoseptoria tritici ST99CH_3D1]
MEYEIISSLATLVGGVRFHFSDPLIDIGVSFMEAPQSDEFSLLPSYRFDGITHGIIVEDCRCATDSSTSAVDVAKVRSLGDERAILALTKWDQIGMIDESDMGRATDIQRETASNLAEKSADLEQEMAAVQIEREELDPFSEVQRFEELDLRWEELKILTRHAFNAEKAHRIYVLGEQAGQHLLRRELRRCHRVPIFSISNLDYAAHLKAFRPEETPAVSVETTNIPNLRRLIASLPNRSRINSMRTLLDVTLPLILDRLDLFFVENQLLAALEGGERLKRMIVLARNVQQVRNMLGGPMRRDLDTLCRDWL